MSEISADSDLVRPLATPDVRGFLRDVAATAVTRGVGVAAGVVTLMMTTRLLGPEGRGQFAIAMACLGVTLQFFHFGLHSSATYYLARFPARRPEVTGLLAIFALLGVGLVAVAASALVHRVPALVPNVAPGLIGLALAAAPPAMFVMLAGSAWLGLGRPAYYNGLDLAAKGVGLCSVLMLLWWSVPVLFATYAAAHYLLAIGAYVSLVGWSWPMVDRRVSGEVLRYGSRMFVTNVFMYMVLRQDLFLVNAWLGTGPAGQYSVAVQVSELMLLATASVTAMLFPRLAALKSDLRRRATWQAMTWMAAGLGVVAVGLAASGRPLFGLAFGPRFAEAVPSFWLLLPGLWCLGLNGVLLQYLAAEGMPWFTAVSTGTAAAVNLAANAVCIPRFGIEGAAAASSLTYVLLLAASILYVLSRREPARHAANHDALVP